MIRTGSSWLLALLIASVPVGGETPERTETGPTGDFSITFPSSWRVVPSRWGDRGQLGLYADDPFEIAIVVGSRPLDGEELTLDRRRLLDLLIERTMISTTEMGNEIVEVGRVASLYEDWPAFAAVSTDRERSKIMTHLRSFVHDRAFTVTTLTDNLQGSSELGALVTRVVRSLTLHPPDPAPENAEDATRRQDRLYHWR